FFLRTRPPPSSTLFPYTTLFRSKLAANQFVLAEQTAGGLDPARAAVERPAARRALRVFVRDEDRALIRRLREQVERGVAAQFAVDRKSTRLNSSHDQISYAVFCL